MNPRLFSHNILTYVIYSIGLICSHTESREKKAKNWAANDFYDSDDDEFLDRTGDIEKKRQQRMKRVGKTEEGGALTYDAIVSVNANVYSLKPGQCFNRSSFFFFKTSLNFAKLNNSIGLTE